MTFDFSQAEKDAAAKWSKFAQWISKNPKSGFFVGAGVGFAVRQILAWVFG